MTSSRTSFEVALSWQQRPGGFAGANAACGRETDAGSFSYGNRSAVGSRQSGGEGGLLNSGDGLVESPHNGLRRVLSDLTHRRGGWFADDEQLQRGQVLSSQQQQQPWQQGERNNCGQADDTSRSWSGDDSDAASAAEHRESSKLPAAAGGLLMSLSGILGRLLRSGANPPLLVRDLLLCSFELPMCALQCYQGAHAALQPSSSLGLVGRWVLLAAAAFCSGSSLCHLLLLLLWPRWTMSHRRKFWPLKLSVSHPAMWLAQMMVLHTCARIPPLHGMVGLAAYWGLLDLSPRLFTAW